MGASAGVECVGSERNRSVAIAELVGVLELDRALWMWMLVIECGHFT